MVSGNFHSGNETGLQLSADKCSYLACGPTVEDATHKVGKHIQAAHGVRGFFKAFYKKPLALSAGRDASRDAHG